MDPRLYEQINITEYINRHGHGFTGTLKGQPKDFIVREIMYGEVCDLTSFNIPPLEERGKGEGDTAAASKTVQPSLNASDAPPPSSVDTEVTIESLGEHDQFITFAAQVKDLFYSGKMKELVDQEEYTFVINTTHLTTREERKSLAKDIQQRYPFFKTDSKSSEEVDGVKPIECHVKVHSSYIVLVDLLPEEDLVAAMVFLNNGRDGEGGQKAPTITLPTVHADKEARRRIHNELSKLFHYIETGTDSSSRLTLSFKRQKGRSNKRKLADMEGGGSAGLQLNTFVGMTLRKEGYESLTALMKIADVIGVSVNKISYAGIKDKVAITYQNIVVSNVPPQVIQNKLEVLKPGIQVGNFTYVEKALAVGELDGNYFEITLRALDFGPQDPATVISESMSSLSRDGFINYFGTQRVGDPTSVVKTHHVGLALLKEDFDGFLELMLSPTSSDSKDMRRAKETYQATKSFKDSIDLFPKGATVERLLLRALNRFGSSSPMQVFQSLPYNQKTLYCRGYQSNVWNRVASERIRRFGTKVVPGDLICTKRGDVDAADTVTIYEGLDGGKDVTLSDVVLPLPGYGMVYPPHLLQLYSDILEGDGLSMDKFKNNKMAETSMRGAYRHLVEVPSRVSFAFEEEDNPTAAVVLRFALGSGCYATIALREVMKELRVDEDKGT